MVPLASFGEREKYGQPLAHLESLGTMEFFRRASRRFLCRQSFGWPPVGKTFREDFSFFPLFLLHHIPFSVELLSIRYEKKCWRSVAIEWHRVRLSTKCSLFSQCFTVFLWRMRYRKANIYSTAFTVVWIEIY